MGLGPVEEGHGSPRPEEFLAGGCLVFVWMRGWPGTGPIACVFLLFFLGVRGFGLGFDMTQARSRIDGIQVLPE